MPLRCDAIAPALLALLLVLVAACGEAPERAAPAFDPASRGPQPTPEQALRAYMQVLEHRVKDPYLELFTPETRLMLAGLSVSDAQQGGELRTLSQATGSMQVRRRGELAVIRFGEQHRKVSPYFFRRHDDGWQLDLATARRVLVFDRRNEWTFRSRGHEYAFAFDDQ